MPDPARHAEVTVGAEIPALRKPTSSRMSALWASASGDYDPIHYDRAYALQQKLPDTIVNGRLKIALLAQMLLDWIGPEGALLKVGASHRGMNLVGEEIVCRGRITSCRRDGGARLVELDIWVETPRGEKTAHGTALVSLPG